MLMPLRSASNGRHGSGETSCSALKPNRHAAAQRVDAADHRRVDQAEADHPLGRARTPWRSTSTRVETVTRRPFEPERLLHEAGERVRRVDERAAVVGREARRRRRAGGRRLRSRRCSRSRCRARPRCAPRRGARARADRVDEAVAVQAEPGEAGCCGSPRRRAARGSGAVSRPATRPIQVASGVWPEVVRRRRRCAGSRRAAAQGGLADAARRWSRCRRRSAAGRWGRARERGRQESGPRLSRAVSDGATGPLSHRRRRRSITLATIDAAEDDDHRARRRARAGRAPEAVQQGAEDERAGCPWPMKKPHANSATAEPRADGASSVASVCIELCSM